MVELVCPKCGHVSEISMFKIPLLPSQYPKCPECGTQMVRSKDAGRVSAALEERQQQRDRNIARLRERGIDLYEWKVVGLTRVSGAASDADIQSALDKMALDGWEFVFFCDGPHLIAGAPALVFKRKSVES